MGIKEIKSFLRYLKYSAYYKQGVRAVDKRKAPKKTVVFLVNYPQAWNSVSKIYDEAVKRDDLNVLVFAIPQLKYGEDDSVGISDFVNDAYEYFKQTDVQAIKANTDDGKWVDLKDYEPDYVIYMRSYNQYTPTLYKSFNVCRYAKCFYVPYAYGMLGKNMLSLVLPENFSLTMHRVFFANDSRRKEYAKEQPAYRKNFVNRFRYLGFSRFDFCKTNGSTRDFSNRNYTVAWMPRWATDNKPDQKPSHFLTFYKHFVEYFETHSDMNLIIRPHPLMFSSIIARGIMTEEEVKAFKNRCKDAQNIEIDEKKDYAQTLFEADVLVADYTSLIAEFFMTGKPIVFCDTVEGLNDEGNKICGAAYNETSFDGIIDKLVVLKNRNDELFESRKALIAELLPGKVGEIGKNMLEEIINS